MVRLLASTRQDGTPLLPPCAACGSVEAPRAVQAQAFKKTKNKEKVVNKEFTLMKWICDCGAVVATFKDFKRGSRQYVKGKDKRA